MCLFLHLSLCVLHTEMPYACVHFCVFMSFFFFFLRRQCAACTHERKGNIVCSVSLYSGTYQLKGCCLDSLRWGYSVKKTSHSNVRALGEVFHHTSDYWKYHSWGLSRRHKPRTILWVFFFFYTFTIHTHFLQRHLLNIPRHFTHSSMLSSISSQHYHNHPYETRTYCTTRNKI